MVIFKVVILKWEGVRFCFEGREVEEWLVLLERIYLFVEGREGFN